MRQARAEAGTMDRWERFDKAAAGIARLAGTLYPLLVVASVGVLCWRIAA